MSFPKLEGYVFTEKLGSGSYSTVYKAYTKIGARTVVAVKCIDKSRVKHSGSAVDNLVTEIRLMKSFTHPHIVHMKEFTWDAKNIYIIMEYCCGGDLSKYIHKYGKVPETQVLYFLQQLASALKYLREKGVAHMDLKPHNLLLHKGSDGKYVLKVGDFGFAQHLSSEPARSLRGSPLYMAPEMLAGEYDARADLWSTGVIMYECLFGRAPYSSDSLPELLEKVQRRAPVQIPATPRVSPGCRELLAGLLRHDPAARISYEEFFAHPYLDLDHMPSRENYDKAVSLIRQAVERETAGELRPALRCYGDALRYLLPAARAEPDAVRRSALTAKLTRYMERAEEIKRYLKCPQQDVPSAVGGEGPRGGAPQPAGRSACCTGEASGNSYDFSGTTMNPNNTKDSTNDSNSINGHNETGVPNNNTGVPNNKTGVQNNKNVVPNDSVSVQGDDKACGNELATQNKGKLEKPRGFARFFGKPVPYLDRDNSVEDTKKTDKIEDNAGDMCKIT